MGKHRSKKSSKSKKSKKNKRSRKYSSDSSSSSEWVEKEAIAKTHSDSDEPKRKYTSSESSENSELKRRCSPIENTSSDRSSKREDWMGLPSSFLTTSTADQRRDRDEQKRKDREREQYDPRNCARELNPYWKDGGDGLPKFKKPQYDDVDNRSSSKNTNISKKNYNWKKSREHEVSQYDGRSDSRNTVRTQKNNWKKSRENVVSSEREPEIPQTHNVVNQEFCEDEILTENELNQLAAKMVKAEIMGNTTLVNELKDKLEKARKNVKSNKEDTILLTQTDSQGRSQPVRLQSQYGETSNHKKKRKIETHKDGQRVRYFADDDKYSLKQMFENEKYNSVDDNNKEFMNLAKKIRKNDDLDDLFADNIRNKESDSKIDTRNKDRAIAQHQKMSTSLDNCNKCIQSEKMPKNLMISMGESVYLTLPIHKPLTNGHCLIVPIRHVPCTTQLDENEWSDIRNMRRSLVKMFESKNEDVVFFETATSLAHFPHMSIECVPVPKEEGCSANIYFKKAIDECETEWSQNKKLVSLKGRDVRKAIPKGLPYFFVSFGMEEGYAHVIEDEKLFPRNFAQEVIGGMLDIHHSKWRKPKKENFEEQSKRVLEFSEKWKDFECKT